MARKVILAETFSAELKRCRVKLRLTQQALADATGIPLSNIKAWEQGKQMPNYVNWELLYNYFKCKYIAKDLEVAYLREKGQ